jgi:hypothetical protein
LETISSYVNQELKWRQQKMTQRSFELVADDNTVLARVAWQNILGSLATAEAEDAKWTFKRVGFWRPRVTVHNVGSDDNLAVFEPKWTGAGSLTMDEGSRFHWKSENFWNTQWNWVNEADQTILHYKLEQGFLKTGGKMQVGDLQVKRNQLPLLATLGWYLLILMAEDSAATMVATTSAAIT